jgi:hypothetical protein
MPGTMLNMKTIQVYSLLWNGGWIIWNVKVYNEVMPREYATDFRDYNNSLLNRQAS